MLSAICRESMAHNGLYIVSDSMLDDGAEKCRWQLGFLAVGKYIHTSLECFLLQELLLNSPSYRNNSHRNYRGPRRCLSLYFGL
jgi:hypothetical protein